MTHIELVAECSTNHGGSLSIAKEFIRRFAEAGADFVKFQHTRVKHLRPDDPQYEWMKAAEFHVEQFAELKAECEACGTKFLTTCFNAADIPEILSLGIEAVKIGSGEMTDRAMAPLFLDRGIRVIQSFHFVNDRAWWVRTRDLKHDLLTCVTRYPASERACLKAIECIGHGGVVGYSDHSRGLEMCEWAMEYGARIIEKHVWIEGQARKIGLHEVNHYEFERLREFANSDPSKYEGRWAHA